MGVDDDEQALCNGEVVTREGCCRSIGTHVMKFDRVDKTTTAQTVMDDANAVDELYGRDGG